MGSLKDSNLVADLDLKAQQSCSRTLEGKVAIISGSSSGIGKAIARELSYRGASVVMNYPFPGLQQEGDAAASEMPGPATAVCADMGSTAGPAVLVEAAIASYGRIDILVNNAALAVNKPFEEQTLEDWDLLVNINARGTFLLTQTVLPHLTSPGGRIVNICSASSRAAPPMQTIYAGTKGMVDSFTRVWAKELPPKYGCTVNAVSPGPTRTEGFAAAGEDVMKILQPTIDATPVAARMAVSSEIAYAVGALCEERARWINGLHMHANGGLFID
ncbi:NAD(P)-binding protein, partial [Aureobasidium melanogenum]